MADDQGPGVSAGDGAQGVVYEVAIEVDAAIADAYRAWLHAHVADLLALPGFVSAAVYRVRDPSPPAGCESLCVHYRLRDADALATYLREHAPRMRAAGVERFGDRFRASRRVMVPLTPALPRDDLPPDPPAR